MRTRKQRREEKELEHRLRLEMIMNLSNPVISVSSAGSGSGLSSSEVQEFVQRLTERNVTRNLVLPAGPEIEMIIQPNANMLSGNGNVELQRLVVAMLRNMPGMEITIGRDDLETFGNETLEVTENDFSDTLKIRLVLG